MDVSTSCLVPLSRERLVALSFVFALMPGSTRLDEHNSQVYHTHDSVVASHEAIDRAIRARTWGCRLSAHKHNFTLVLFEPLVLRAPVVSWKREARASSVCGWWWGVAVGHLHYFIPCWLLVAAFALPTVRRMRMEHGTCPG